ncbi:MAG: alpha/beta hydrolase [Litorimonas sp.]
MTRPYRDHVYTSEDGLALYARLYEGDPDATPLLCMHGLSRNSADFHAMLERLPGRPAISVDQRGRGNSAYDPQPANYRPDIYCRDMLHLLDGLGHERVVAVGTSMGGLMTLMMASLRPRLFGAAVINDIGPEIDPAGLARLGGYVGGQMRFANWAEAVAAVRAQNPDDGPDIFAGFTDADWLDFTRNLCGPTPDGGVAFRYDPAIADGLGGDEPSAAPPDLWPVFEASAGFPMLVIRGETSDILSDATARAMVERRPQTGLVTVPRRGHAPTLTEPVAIDAIRTFLETAA